ncbi:hypothetical protein LTR62_008126 [Meristemomyces frigidus]|uniref:Ribonuclease T2-like n=1 Tax=Meristemomyces frigidus TaxID=1508187 RepID=A0AAN7TA38_9PEZI|nr:hypothetical protein LTR62_008126 [Meristemomyces frigidus]
MDNLHNALPALLGNAKDRLVETMPSLRSWTTLALSSLGTAQQVLGRTSPLARQSGFDLSNSATCTDPQLSCHNTSAIANLCCFNSPGGALLQTQFWDTAPVTGPVDSWTIHGLWPDNCDGTYDASCDDTRAYTNITAILQSFGATDLLSYMQTYWVSNSGTSESFWEHEWGKHGTCVSTLDPDCYTNYQPTEEVPQFFNRTVELFKTSPTYDWLSAAGIVPSSSATYTTAQIQAALSSEHGGHNAYLGCSSGALTEVWYFFNVAGSVQTGTFEPSDVIGASSTCPSTGIKYLPKDNGASPTGTATTTRTSTAARTSAQTSTVAPAPTSTGPAFSGNGYLNVMTGGSQIGCIIGAGTWYTTGSCAGFTASPASPSDDDAFTLSSRKGDCGVVSGVLTCGGSITTPSTFSSTDSGTLTYAGNSTFYADGVPSGSKQGTVYTDSSHGTSLTIQWQAR